jgi:hypothetical protein
MSLTDQLAAAEARLRAWHAANPRPQPLRPAPLGPPKGTPDRQRLRSEALAAWYAEWQPALAQWEAAHAQVTAESQVQQLRAAVYAEDDAATRAAAEATYGSLLAALDWAQARAGQNKQALIYGRSVRQGTRPTPAASLRAWYPGAAQYVMRALRRAGGKREHTSETTGARGSVYYRLPDGRCVRLSDHHLPETEERAYRRSLGQTGRWAQIVLDQILTEAEIDERIAEVLDPEVLA